MIKTPEKLLTIEQVKVNYALAIISMRVMAAQFERQYQDLPAGAEKERIGTYVMGTLGSIEKDQEILAQIITASDPHNQKGREAALAAYQTLVTERDSALMRYKLYGRDDFGEGIKNGNLVASDAYFESVPQAEKVQPATSEQIEAKRGYLLSHAEEQELYSASAAKFFGIDHRPVEE